MTDQVAIDAARAPLAATWRDYLTLMKPRLMSLVILTAVTGLVCARANLSPVLAAVAILCVALGAGGSAALNMGYDADIDALMRRTRGRPVPAGRVQRAREPGPGRRSGERLRKEDSRAENPSADRSRFQPSSASQPSQSFQLLDWFQK